MFPHDYIIKDSDVNCRLRMTELKCPECGPNFWLLGETFMKVIYTVFDFDKRKIGFAESKYKL